MEKKMAVILVLIAGFVVAGVWVFMAGRQNSPVVPDVIKVTTSFYPLYFFTQQIGGDRVHVINITPAGAEPHDYEPTAQDIAQIDNSRLLVLNGSLEPWGDDIKQNLNSENTVIVTVGDGIINQQVMEEGKNITDPHIWQSPVLAKKIVDKIMQEFIQIDPTSKDYYQSNANDLKAKLDVLDSDYKHGLAHCAQKDIITSHAAFGYLATAYGLNQVPISGLSPDAEPSPKQLADVVIFAKSHKVSYIFFESLVSPKLSDTIATEVGAKTMVLNPIEGLTNEEISQGKNYFTEMEKNLTNLKIALQCA